MSLMDLLEWSSKILRKPGLGLSAMPGFFMPSAGVDAIHWADAESCVCRSRKLSRSRTR